ncbi:TatD family hydrolase [Paenibacillus sp. GSMTC-2017]|nr:TatD family hydrolase [Paenibacillus sp. GSMTC-2017]
MRGVDNFACIDAHLHVDLYTEEERTTLLEEAFRDGVEAVIAVSMNLASSKTNDGLAKKYAGRVHPAFGYHPEQELPSAAEREQLFRWIRERDAAGEAFAIGEVGLPYYKRTELEATGEPFNETPYLSLLESFVALAAELDRPIVLHAVYEDADKVCDLLQRYGIRRAHFHWFKGSRDTVERMIKAGYFISITPDVAYEREIIELVEQYPIHLLMAETDGPWLFEGPYSGQSTNPSMVRHVIADIAAVKGMNAAKVASVLLENTKRFYDI